jgi:hypothetical protein
MPVFGARPQAGQEAQGRRIEALPIRPRGGRQFGWEVLWTGPLVQTLYGNIRIAMQSRRQDRGQFAERLTQPLVGVLDLRLTGGNMVEFGLALRQSRFALHGPECRALTGGLARRGEH